MSEPTPPDDRDQPGKQPDHQPTGAGASSNQGPAAWSTAGAWSASGDEPRADDSPRRSINYGPPGSGPGEEGSCEGATRRRGPFEATLFDTNLPPWRYVLRVWPLATLPTLGIATILVILTHLFGYEQLFDQQQWDFNIQSPVLLFAEIVIGAPLMETMLMAPLLALLRRYVRHRWWVICSSAFVWAIMHSLSVPIWGVCIFWTFVVFSAAFEAWRPRGFWYAYFVTAGIHALNNALAGLGLLM